MMAEFEDGCHRRAAHDVQGVSQITPPFQFYFYFFYHEFGSSGTQMDLQMTRSSNFLSSKERLESATNFGILNEKVLNKISK